MQREPVSKLGIMGCKIACVPHAEESEGERKLSPERRTVIIRAVANKEMHQGELSFRQTMEMGGIRRNYNEAKSQHWQGRKIYVLRPAGRK